MVKRNKTILSPQKSPEVLQNKNIKKQGKNRKIFTVQLSKLSLVRAMVSAVNCVRLMTHRPVPLKQITHYVLTKK